MTPRRHNSNRQSAAAAAAAADDDDDDDGGAVIRCDENESEIELSAALAATSRLLSSPKPGHLPPPTPTPGHLPPPSTDIADIYDTTRYEMLF